MHTLQTLNIKDLAKILHKTEKTVADDVTRRPEALPPRLHIPNSRKVIWRMVDVEEWLASRVQKKIGRSRQNHDK